jgi:hypothetical protein
MRASFFHGHGSWSPHFLVILLLWTLLALTLPAAAMAQFPAFGIIASVTGETQFVIDIKSSPDAKPDRDQRVINVMGVRSTGRDANGVFQLERLVLGRDVELQNCTRRPLTSEQLFCDVMINLGRSTTPPVSLAEMLKAWGLALPGQDGARPTTESTSGSAGSGSAGPSFKALPPLPLPRGSKS